MEFLINVLKNIHVVENHSRCVISSNNMQEKCGPNQILVFPISTRRPICKATHVYLHCVKYSCINIVLLDV